MIRAAAGAASPSLGRAQPHTWVRAVPWSVYVGVTETSCIRGFPSAPTCVKPSASNGAGACTITSEYVAAASVHRLLEGVHVGLELMQRLVLVRGGKQHVPDHERLEEHCVPPTLKQFSSGTRNKIADLPNRALICVRSAILYR